MRAICLVVMLGALAASDWRQWRGFSRNGATSYKVDFEKLPAELTADWNVEIGTGYAGPIVSGERVYTFSRQQGREVVRALDRATGKPIWRADYPAPFQKNAAATAMQEARSPRRCSTTTRTW